MLRLPPFRYLRAGSAAEAARALADHGGRAMILAGGTDLLPNLKRRQFDAEVLVAIGHLAELREASANGELVLGAGMRLRGVVAAAERVEGLAAIAEAVGQIANPQIQRQGTIGGNLCVDTRCNYYNQSEEWRAAIGYCMKRDGDICLVAPGSAKCWAVSSSDAAPALMALGARVVLQGPEGERDIPLRDLYRDDGIDYLSRRPDEVLTRILVPRLPGQRSTYRKVRRRGSFDFPILGIAASLQMAGETVEAARLVLGGVHTHPVEVAAAAELLCGRPLTEESIEAAAEAAFKAATPLDNADLMYHWRKKMVRVEVRRALRSLAGG
ncbi:MAG TPA: FAD binding domain-containing protein [Acidobacteriota bacterium]